VCDEFRFRPIARDGDEDGELQKAPGSKPRGLWIVLAYERNGTVEALPLQVTISAELAS